MVYKLFRFGNGMFYIIKLIRDAPIKQWISLFKFIFFNNARNINNNIKIKRVGYNPHLNI